jgi:hypothetical protein
MGIDLLAAELSPQIAHNEACIDDIDDTTNNHKFEFTLSVSTQTVRTKVEGGKITAFKTITTDTEDEDQIREIVSSRNYSTNVWAGSCANQNYIGMTGVILDFDGGLTLEDAREMFYGYRYIMHTSASHQVKEPKGDRFRVILPFAPGVPRFVTGEECRRVYRKLLGMYPHADAACVDPGRKYFPHTDELGAEFILDINPTGRYFDIDVSDTVIAVEAEFEHREWDGVLQPKAELDRVLKFCPFVRWMDKHIDDPTVHISEPLKYALISNLCWFEGGRDAIHGILRRDVRPEKYDADLIDQKIDRVREIGPHKYVTIARLSAVNAVLWGWSGDNWKGPASPAGWAKFGHTTKTGYVQIEWTDDLILRAGEDWTVVDLTTLKEQHLSRHGHVQAICPVCDCDGASAQLDEFNFARIWCERCKHAYYEAPLSPNMFTYKNKLLRVEKRGGRFISIEVLDEPSFRNRKDFLFAQKKLMTDPNRRFLDDSFQIQRIGNADYAELDYEFRMNDNALVFRYPAIPVDVKDNAMIDGFLDTMFGPYANFAKDWMALYSYTNYVSLPVMVLTGERSCGKNTFAEMIGAMFPALFGLWDGGKERFNDQYTKKLLFVDENPNSDKPTQYTEIKKITGNKLLRIDEKYTPAYYVQNNVKIIIATNDPRPMFLKAREEPKSENTNNFFIYRCPDVDPDKIDKTLGEKLQARLGWYVRSELGARYQRLALQATSKNRYALSAPITPLARSLFASAKSTIEIEAEELARHLVFGVNIPNLKNAYAPNIHFQAYAFNGAKYVQFQEIRDLVGQLGFKGSPAQPKSYVTVLQDQKVLSHETARCAERHLGYKILRDRSYYTTTISGVLPVVDDGNDVLGVVKTDFLHPPKLSILESLDTPDDGNDENDTPF